MHLSGRKLSLCNSANYRQLWSSFKFQEAQDSVTKKTSNRFHRQKEFFLQRVRGEKSIFYKLSFHNLSLFEHLFQIGHFGGNGKSQDTYESNGEFQYMQMWTVGKVQFKVSKTLKEHFFSTSNKIIIEEFKKTNRKPQPLTLNSL